MSNPNTIEVVKGMRALLSDEEKWIKSDYAQDNAGKQVSSTNVDATCWCLQGAMNRVMCKERPEFYDHYSEIYQEIQLFFPHVSMIYFIDDRATKHSDVIEKLDSIIEALSHDVT